MKSKEEIIKNIVNARLLKNYASWIYCNGCNKTVGYLCYVTYNYFKLNFTCKCGNKGVVEIIKGRDNERKEDNDLLFQRKGRYCCLKDESPLFSLVDKNLNEYMVEVVCKNCKTVYKESNIAIK